MAKNINNIHDKFFKAMMSDKQLASDFFLCFLPKQVLEHIELSSLTPLQNGFISKELNEVFSDVVFLFRLKKSEQECYVSILIEHKSIKDELAPFQILGYLAQGYESQIKSKQRLRLIIPFLFYHGKSKWVLKPVSKFFKDYPTDLKLYIPDYQSIFVDLSTMSDDNIMNVANLLLASALLSQKYSASPKVLEQRLMKIFQALSEQTNRNFIITLVVYLFQVVEIKENLIHIIENVPDTIKNEIMSTYDYLIQKGEEIGIRKGEEIGIRKGEEIGIRKGKEIGTEKKEIEIVLNAFTQGLSVAIIANITNLSEKRVKDILTKYNA